VADVTALVRIHRSPAGLTTGLGAGRGAWLCREHPVVCLDEAVKKRAVSRALRLTVGNDEIELLRARLDAGSLPVVGVPVSGETGEVCNTK
jgi:predicted RNA-binding protein YlxR (DUF448 family)